MSAIFNFQACMISEEENLESKRIHSWLAISIPAISIVLHWFSSILMLYICVFVAPIPFNSTESITYTYSDIIYVVCFYPRFSVPLTHRTERFFIEQRKSSNQKVLQFKVYNFCRCSDKFQFHSSRLRRANSMSIRVVNAVYCCECLLQGNQRMAKQQFKTFVFIWIRLRSLVKVLCIGWKPKFACAI